MRTPPTAPDATHWLGTDPRGRDQLSRFLWGGRLTLSALFVALLLRFGIGVVAGLAAGWWPGAPARALRAVGAVTNGAPALLLALLLVLLLRDVGFIGYAFAVAFVGWADVAQFTALHVARLRASPFLEAAYALGGRPRWILREHVLRVIAPHFAGLVALEAAAILVLLAELGFIGLFIAPATFYRTEFGDVLFPLRDRAPEWAQLLSGVRLYGVESRVVVLIPAILVGAVIIVFQLAGEGLRLASDTHAEQRLSRPAFQRLGTGVVALAAVSALVLGVITLRPATITFEEGIVAASGSADRVLPGSRLVAAAAHFRSDRYALERPSRLSYYFYREGREGARLVRVTFVDAERLQVEIRPDENEDQVELAGMRDVREAETLVDIREAVRVGLEQGAAHFRERQAAWSLRVVFEWPEARAGARYRLRWADVIGQVRIQQEVDARTVQVTDTTPGRPPIIVPTRRP